MRDAGSQRERIGHHELSGLLQWMSRLACNKPLAIEDAGPTCSNFLNTSHQ